MQPSLLSRAQMDAYLAAGHWTTQTMVESFAGYVETQAQAIACRDDDAHYTWAQLEEITDRLAAALIAMGLERDSRAIVQMPSSAREMVLRIAFKKAGIIGVFAPLQWRRRELDYVAGRTQPSLAVMDSAELDAAEIAWLDGMAAASAERIHRIDLSSRGHPGWLDWDHLMAAAPNSEALEQIAVRRFRYDEVSLITASSGTSGLAKLCEWPEAAQVCVGRVIGERLRMTEADNVGVFAPMSGAAGVLVWAVSGTTPCTFTFPAGFDAHSLLELAAREKITVATTVPVILARLAREPLEDHDLSALRAIRVGTAAADTTAAAAIEDRTTCRVVVAAGSMEVPGFAHAHIDEPSALRLSGVIGLPLPGAEIAIEDEDGNALTPGEPGELKITAPFAASGYWDDPDANTEAWTDGWYATGDLGVLGADGRLSLMGRMGDIINRSGHKILPAELETEIAAHPDVIECAVVKASDAEYGEVPWAFVQMKPDRPFDADTLLHGLKSGGLASYKFPARFLPVTEFPRVAGNKVDKKALLSAAPPPSE